jgi:Ca2+-binding EF-hand superfamily protein
VFKAIDTDRSGYIDWEEFLQAMSVVMKGSNEDKLDLFFRLYDDDQSGTLTFDEIRDVCIQRLVQTDEEIDGTIETIGDYFARLIFESAGVPLNGEITKDGLKFAVQNSREKELIDMFCSIT